MTSTAHDDTSLSTACHSLVVRLSEPAGEPAARARLAELVRRHPVFGTIRAWHENVGREGEIADRVAEREARRELSPKGPRLRMTFVHQPGGRSEAVLVADRAVLDLEALRYAAAVLKGDSIDEAEAPALPESLTTPAGHQAIRRRQRVDWGLPDSGAPGSIDAVAVELPAAGAVTEPVFLAAAALVVARYDGTALSRVAIRDRDTAVVEIDEDERVECYLQRVEKACREADVPGGEPPIVRLLGTPHDPDAGYLPYLSPWNPLTIQAGLDGDRVVSARCWFDARAVHPAIARSFARHVVHVAAQLAAVSPDQELSGIALMTPEESAGLLATGATPPAAGSPRSTVHQTFRAITGRHPNRPAVSDQTGVLTYQTLCQEAERQASGLSVLGVRAGDLVGVCLDRNTDLVVALLAILMVGAAYVPIDPSSPSGRVREIVADAGLDFVVSDRDEFPAPDRVRVIAPSVLTARAPLADYSPELETAAAESTACVLYSDSGGVMITHGNILSLLAATAGLDFRETDVWTLIHPDTSELPIWEIWGCLLTGGRLVVVPAGGSRSASGLRELLRREQVTVVNQTPPAFALLIAADAWCDDALAVRIVVLGGEPLADARILRSWFHRYPSPGCQVLTMFGTLETTVHVTAEQVTPADLRSRSRSVGRALPGWSVSVRDRRGRLLPLGVAGEVYVGGTGVAAGYLQREDLTAERFTADPVSGRRIFRSGVRGRLCVDGGLEFLGPAV